MTLSDWVTATLGALGILASIFTASRDFRARRLGERIDKLATIQRQLQNLGPLGMDTRVDASLRESTHEALVERTRVAIRRNAAEYVAIASKPNPSRLTAGLLLSYGLVVTVAGIGQIMSASPAASPAAATSLSAGIAFAGTGAVIFILGIRHARLVRAAVRRDRSSGVNLTSFGDEVRGYLANARRIFASQPGRDSVG